MAALPEDLCHCFSAQNICISPWVPSPEDDAEIKIQVQAVCLGGKHRYSRKGAENWTHGGEAQRVLLNVYSGGPCWSFNPAGETPGATT